MGRGATALGGVLGKEGGLAAERGPEGRGEVPSGGRCFLVSCTSCLPACTSTTNDVTDSTSNSTCDMY